MRSFKSEVFISPFGPTIVTLDIVSGDDDNRSIDLGGGGGKAKVIMHEDGMGSPCLLFATNSREL